MKEGHAWDVALEQGTVTKRGKEKLDNYLNYFNSRIKDGRVVTYANGFFGVGILTRPRKHVTKDNILWLYGVSLKEKGRIVEDINAETSLDEASDMVDCLRIAIGKVKGKAE